MDVRKMLIALGDPTRLAVFECVLGCGGSSAYDTETGQCDAGSVGAVASCDVKCQLPCAPNTVSHHLSILREVGLITSEKRGREVYVSVVPEALEALADFFSLRQATDPCCSGGSNLIHLQK
ncbi:MAG: helix-turn-helix transcriptional regulator [Armatimonadetes bacterium]|nr:helix-turn-helix transcriptional regulator [Armatimonadota bacterium]